MKTGDDGKKQSKKPAAPKPAASVDQAPEATGQVLETAGGSQAVEAAASDEYAEAVYDGDSEMAAEEVPHEGDSACRDAVETMADTVETTIDATANAVMQEAREIGKDARNVAAISRGRRRDNHQSVH